MDPVVTVLATDTGTGAVAGARHDLAPGQRLEFGACLCGTCGYDLVVRDPAAGQIAGRLTAGDDHWRLHNLGAAPLSVEDLEHPLHLVTVDTHGEAVISFELARITAGGTPIATVFGPEPATTATPGQPCPLVPARRSRYDLDEQSTYFAILTLLCEPRLRGPAHRPLPTSAEVAALLAGRRLRLSSRAVEAHIDYLTTKLGLTPPDGNPATRRAWRKEALVTVALRNGIVRPHHSDRVTSPPAPPAPDDTVRG